MLMILGGSLISDVALTEAIGWIRGNERHCISYRKRGMPL